MLISILIAGDLVPHERTVPLFEAHKTDYLFGDILSLIRESDFSVVNFEAPIILDKLTPIRKSGPNLYSSLAAMEVVKDAGFDMITLANNHFRDQGQSGVCNTLSCADSIGLNYVGGGKNLEEARKISYQCIKDKIFAFINVCEHEYSIAEDEYGGSNPYDLINIHHDIIEARKRADYVILIIHAGIEHYPLPSPRMKREYRYFVELGADVVINHHQHCCSGYEVYQGKPIFYGLGNFCFDLKVYRNNGMWDKGWLVRLLFEDNNIGFSLFPIQQCANTPNVRLLESDAFASILDNLNQIIGDDRLLEEEYEQWVTKKTKQRISQLNAFGNKFFDKLYKRGWLGNLHSIQRLYLIKNLLYCESHLDVLRRILKLNIKK
ncbi:MAG TPA: CapA family protein [Bacteroidales bacterium]|jgi:poly-gamma-glutamate synthesis protein (capsule biosynthesis protein)|nr:CapA family protein [Bacteroidales bacterium]